MTIREKLKTVKTNKKYRVFIRIKNRNNKTEAMVPLTFKNAITQKLDLEFTSFKKEVEQFTKETILSFVI